MTALMLAFDLFCDTRESYRAEWKEKKRNPPKLNPYQAMKNQMGL